MKQFKPNYNIYNILHYIYEYVENIQDYNFACDFVWVRNLVSDIKGGT
jgi:hypothetical protein